MNLPVIQFDVGHRTIDVFLSIGIKVTINCEISKNRK